jgi:hypothetical protein
VVGSQKKAEGVSGLGCWWRRRESNPRPQMLCLQFYMLIRLYGFNRSLPERQGGRPTIPADFSTSAPDELQCELILGLPPKLAAYKRAANRRLADLSS